MVLGLDTPTVSRSRLLYQYPHSGSEKLTVFENHVTSRCLDHFRVFVFKEKEKNALGLDLLEIQ